MDKSMLKAEEAASNPRLPMQPNKASRAFSPPPPLLAIMDSLKPTFCKANICLWLETHAPPVIPEGIGQLPVLLYEERVSTTFIYRRAWRNLSIKWPFCLNYVAN